MDAAQIEDFRFVDVADTGHDVLVEQDLGYRTGLAPGPPQKLSGIEVAEEVGPEMRHFRFDPRSPIHLDNGSPVT